ncbi:DAPG hydrolase family protein [Sphingobium sp.]|uniref:DAPG hydrolase family protein n=1 Tax=Sphingobium sp. TaxID=1912891 RepID=UPI0028BEB344|nr:hypothetical protein [Sphingobium sp.]
MDYQVTKADRAPVPAGYHTEPRYLGYRDADYARPYAHYFKERLIPVQPHIKEALTSGPVSGAYGSRISTVADEMSKPGYLHMETGYTINDDGHLVIAIFTDMPGVTAEMWDWWMWWHAVEAARYKLWHPEAHLLAMYTEDRSQTKGLTDRQRWQGNSCHIDEYIGETRSFLRAGFQDPAKIGFDLRPGETVITARGGLSTAPLGVAWMIHHVRPTSNGCEMRSRFIANDLRMLALPMHSMTSTTGKFLTLPGVRQLAESIVRNVKPPHKLHEICPSMLFHCGAEMNHLASFLPQLYAEFADPNR